MHNFAAMDILDDIEKIEPDVHPDAPDIFGEEYDHTVTAFFSGEGDARRFAEIAGYVLGAYADGLCTEVINNSQKGEGHVRLDRVFDRTADYWRQFSGWFMLVIRFSATGRFLIRAAFCLMSELFRRDIYHRVWVPSGDVSGKMERRSIVCRNEACLLADGITLPERGTQGAARCISSFISGTRTPVPEDRILAFTSRINERNRRIWTYHLVSRIN